MHKDVVDSDGDGQFDVGNIRDVYPKSYAPGNFGLLDFDGGSNPTPDLNQWIEEGWDQPFVIPPGGSIEIYGNPGIHGSSIADALQEVVDEQQVRFIAVHDSVSGQGNNTLYNVIAVVAVKVLDFKLTGNNKHIDVEIITSASSALAVAEQAPESETLVKPRLAL